MRWWIAPPQPVAAGTIATCRTASDAAASLAPAVVEATQDELAMFGVVGFVPEADIQAADKDSNGMLEPIEMMGLLQRLLPRGPKAKESGALWAEAPKPDARSQSAAAIAAAACTEVVGRPTSDPPCGAGTDAELDQYGVEHNFHQLRLRSNQILLIPAGWSHVGCLTSATPPNLRGVVLRGMVHNATAPADYPWLESHVAWMLINWHLYAMDWFEFKTINGVPGSQG